MLRLTCLRAFAAHLHRATAKAREFSRRPSLQKGSIASAHPCWKDRPAFPKQYLRLVDSGLPSRSPERLHIWRIIYPLLDRSNFLFFGTRRLTASDMEILRAASKKRSWFASLTLQRCIRG